MKKILVTVVIIIAGVLVVTKTIGKKEGIVLTKEVKINREQNEEAQEMEGEQEAQYIEGEILVKFKEDLAGEEIDNFASDYNLKMMDIIKGINVYKFKLPEGKTVKEIVELLTQDTRVKYAEPNYIFKLQ